MYKQAIYLTICVFLGLFISPPVLAVNTLIDNGNGSVTDIATGLLWQKQDDDISREHADASAYCAELTLANESDWRLPNVKELPTIVDYRLMRPAIDDAKFPNTDLRQYWTATSAVGDLRSAWVVSFSSGAIGNLLINNRFLVRCVRDAS